MAAEAASFKNEMFSTSFISKVLNSPPCTPSITTNGPSALLDLFPAASIFIPVYPRRFIDWSAPGPPLDEAIFTPATFPCIACVKVETVRFSNSLLSI